MINNMIYIYIGHLTHDKQYTCISNFKDTGILWWSRR